MNLFISIDPYPIITVPAEDEASPDDDTLPDICQPILDMLVKQEHLDTTVLRA